MTLITLSKFIEIPTWVVLQHLPVILFLFGVGACVGSFLNVCVYRLPAQMSVISPPSRCPICGARLKFFGENLPIIGWFLIRGKCRYCKAPVSAQYMIIELIMSLVFVGLYAALYWRESPFGNDWWAHNTFWRTWPAFIALATLISGLVAMTLIDARTFTIPIEIPLVVTFTAFVAWPVQVLIDPLSNMTPNWPIPVVGWTGIAISAGGMAGILVGLILLRTGKLRMSFHDYDEYVKDDEPLADYPHGRREMGVELLYLAPCLIGMVAGGFLARSLPASPPPEVLQAIGGSFAGYLSGGALVWGIRILGTLGFGREAMGLGDVHLLAAVGAVLGWFDPILIFFIAPFLALLWTAGSLAMTKVLRTSRRELPYGPHLALATIIVMAARPWILVVLDRLFFHGMVPLPMPGLG